MQRSFARAFLFALALGSWSQAGAARADANQEARASFESGVEASRAQRWEEARAQFTRSLELVPKASTMFNLALAYVKLGRGPEALQQLDQFEGAASQSEHAEMLERARVLRAQAEALIESSQASAEHGGQVLSKQEDGYSEEVRAQVEQARNDYARGRDREALAGFERAYASSRRAQLLYNIGVVADRLREDRKAARAYDKFVAASPDAPEAAVAQVRSAALFAALAERERAAEQQASRNAYTPGPRSDGDVDVSLRRPRTMLITGSILLVGGATGTAVAGALMGKNLSGYNECIDSDDCTNKDALRAQRALMYTGAIVGGAALATGLALTITGAVRYNQAKRDRMRAMAYVPSLELARGSALLSWRGHF